MGKCALAAEWGTGIPRMLLERRGPRVSSSWPARHILAQLPSPSVTTPGRHRVDKDESCQAFGTRGSDLGSPGIRLSLHTVQHQRTPLPGRPSWQLLCSLPVGLSDSSKRGQAHPCPGEAICSQPKVARGGVAEAGGRGKEIQVCEMGEALSDRLWPTQEREGLLWAWGPPADVE